MRATASFSRRWTLTRAALDVRRRPAVLAAAPDGASQLLGEGVELGASLLASAEVVEAVRLAQLLAEEVDPLAVLCLGARVQHRTRISRRVLHTGQLEHVELAPGLSDQDFQIREAFGVLEPEAAAAALDAPDVPVAVQPEPDELGGRGRRRARRTSRRERRLSALSTLPSQRDERHGTDALAQLDRDARHRPRADGEAAPAAAR
jgi:hypothetical protein